MQAIVIDVNGMSDIDYAGAQMLGGLATELEQRGVTTGVARSSHLVHHDLKHSRLLEIIGPNHLFATVEDAIVSLAKDA
ncbi:MAG: sodium-independent anion transporter [Solirubrobacteraceae bacterium]